MAFIRSMDAPASSRFDGCARSAAAGQGSIFLLSGEAGIGKTRLAAELVQRGRDRGVTVFWGRAWEVEGARSCWPWVQVLGACVQMNKVRPSWSRARAPRPRPAAVTGVRRSWFQQPGARIAATRFGVVALLQRLSRERPLVLVFDDLHAKRSCFTESAGSSRARAPRPSCARTGHLRRARGATLP